MRKNNILSTSPTLKDVAQRANVSPITVSRVFNPKWEGLVEQKTVDKVIRAAKEIGYNQSSVDRSLNSDKTNIVAVVMGVETGHFYKEVLLQLIEKIQSVGKQVLVFVANPDFGIEKVVQQLNQYRVEAIIVTSPATKSGIMNYFTNNKIPLIIFNKKIKDSSASAIWSDTLRAVDKVVALIKDNGYTDIGFISGKSEDERSQRFVNRVIENRLTLLYKSEGDYSYESGYEAACEMLSNSKRPHVIFCSCDNMAMGAMDAARKEFNLSIPEDICVIGFDDNCVANYKSYDLTTIKQPLSAMIDYTIEVIDDLLENPNRQILREFDMEIVMRSSFRPRD